MWACIWWCLISLYLKSHSHFPLQQPGGGKPSLSFLSLPTGNYYTNNRNRRKAILTEKLSLLLWFTSIPYFVLVINSVLMTWLERRKMWVSARGMASLRGQAGEDSRSQLGTVSTKQMEDGEAVPSTLNMCLSQEGSHHLWTVGTTGSRRSPNNCPHVERAVHNLICITLASYK